MPVHDLVRSTARAEARAVSKAQLRGWLAVGGGLASLPTMAVVVPMCQSSSAAELLRNLEQHKRIPAVWRERFAAAGVELPAMSEGYVCVIGAVR